MSSGTIRALQRKEMVNFECWNSIGHATYVLTEPSDPGPATSYQLLVTAAFPSSRRGSAAPMPQIVNN
jgi:hypothetical protein